MHHGTCQTPPAPIDLQRSKMPSPPQTPKPDTYSPTLAVAGQMYLLQASPFSYPPFSAPSSPFPLISQSSIFSPSHSSSSPPFLFLPSSYSPNLQVVASHVNGCGWPGPCIWLKGRYGGWDGGGGGVLAAPGSHAGKG